MGCLKYEYDNTFWQHFNIIIVVVVEMLFNNRCKFQITIMSH